MDLDWRYLKFLHTASGVQERTALLGLCRVQTRTRTSDKKTMKDEDGDDNLLSESRQEELRLLGMRTQWEGQRAYTSRKKS